MMELESCLMKLSVFIKNQVEGPNPFFCIDKDHLMPLVPFMKEDLTIELKCFVPNCDFKLIPGIDIYEKLIHGKTN